MRKAFMILPVLLLAGCASADNITPLEKTVYARALENQAMSDEHFLEMIESGASPKEQGAYLYGMGIAQEKLGNRTEAINDYLCAEMLGSEAGRRALNRMGIKR